MTAKQLAAGDVGLPRFDVPEGGEGDVFALSSHKRARDALGFGLAFTEPRFNIFVVGADRSARMTATMEFLRGAVDDRAVPTDWVYLNNFREPDKPRPFALPAGAGRRFRRRIEGLMPQLREALSRAFSAEAYEAQIRETGEKLQAEISEQVDAVRAEARQAGLDLVQTPQGLQVLPVDDEGKPVDPQAVDEDKRKTLEDAIRRIGGSLREVDRAAGRRKIELAGQLEELSRVVAENAIGGLIDAFVFEFQEILGLSHWLTEMRADILENINRFQTPDPNAPPRPSALPEQRYAVNLLVDNTDRKQPEVVLEANPTVANLFGFLEYRQSGGVLETDFTQIRAGALHHANGGILVLRAESLATTPFVWELLKGVLRDQAIHIEEVHRSGQIPLAGAPRPLPIPLDVKIVIVGAPQWYYAFFSRDPDFRAYFKIKADVDSEMDATSENVACMAGLIRKAASGLGGFSCAPGAIGRLLGVASRWTGNREKLTARIELIEDTISEAAQMVGPDGDKNISEACVEVALRNRRQRNARIEDRMHESIAEGTVMIDTSGAVRGQVNALTVRDLGDHAFGAPSRVTARASVGRRGVINIERDIAMGGPIQQKGVMVLQGFLAGRFARRIPLSFNCSITFEQNYGGVEGDSASMAELIAIVSDLAGLDLRQDIAITGSVNQRGQSQAIGGAHHKIEGFFRACQDQGGLTGTQGVVVPAANEVNLVVSDEVAEAVADGRFHVWSVATVDEAIELFTGMPAGVPDADCAYPEGTVFARVVAELEDFDRILTAREIGGA